MKYLIQPNSANGGQGSVSPNGICDYGASGPPCPPTCYHCKTKVVNCLKPLGPGFSLTGTPEQED